MIWEGYGIGERVMEINISKYGSDCIDNIFVVYNDDVIVFL